MLIKTIFRAVLLLSIVVGPYFKAHSQEKVTLNGYIRDASNGEELIGVTAYVSELKGGSASNHYGFYSITLAKGTYTVIFSYVGYRNITKIIDLDTNISLNIEMEPDVTELTDVVITAEKEDVNIDDIKMSSQSIDVNQVKLLPALFGEADIIKNVQMQPGVISAGEGTSGYFVRGGTSDQNLILIDEAPIYDPSHLFGLFSVFNADVIKDSELIKGGIPAQYGGRLSSILDVRTKDGNNKKLEGSAGIGLLSSRVLLEGPIKKDASSFIFSARRSYVDVLTAGATDGNKVYFYDLNGKINWRKNNNNRFFVAGYFGRDVQKFGDDGSFGWGNGTATFRWNHLFNDRLFSNTSLIYSNFDYNLEITDPTQGLNWSAGIRQAMFKEDFTYYLNPNNEISFGYHGSYRKFKPGKIAPNSENSIFETTILENYQALDHALYIGNEMRVSDRLILQYGLRYSIFQNVGSSTIYEYEDPQDNINKTRVDSTKYGNFETIKVFHNLQPRFSARYKLDDVTSFKASYNRMVQNVHLLSNSVVSLPFNTWWPSSPYIGPQLSDQVAIGYFKNLRDNAYEFSSEVYYKKLNNLAVFADNANVFFNMDLPVEIRNGESDSYGLELYLKKNKGNLKGFVSYTLSKTDLDIAGVNENRQFPASHDRRHNLSIVGTYVVNDKWTLGSNFVYNTGRAFTLPVGKYEMDGYNMDYYTGRNQYRLPDYHRLDFSATLTSRKNKGRKWKSSWTFAVYNAYNRKNPFTIYTRTKQDKDGNIIGDGTEKEARLIYLFPVLPSITYNIKF